MSIDIIIYAVIAVVLLNRLWSVLGQKHDGDDQRPPPANPFQPPSSRDQSTADLSATAPALPMGPVVRVSAAPESLAGGLEHIKRYDPAFDEKAFVQGARAAFTTIVEEFGRGELVTSERLLGAQVRANFKAAIAQRRAEGHSLECKVARIRDADVLAARMNGDKALLTVRFISEQTNILRDQSGQIVAGTEGQLEEVTDLWVFCRDMTSPDPNWQLVETKVAE